MAVMMLVQLGGASKSILMMLCAVLVTNEGRLFIDLPTCVGADDDEMERTLVTRPCQTHSDCKETVKLP
jgi:hypothetical protein